MQFIQTLIVAQATLCNGCVCVCGGGGEYFKTGEA